MQLAVGDPLHTAVLGASQVVTASHGVTGVLSALNEAPATEASAVAHQEEPVTLDAPPAAFGVAGEAAIDPDGREMELAAGRLRLGLAQAAPGAIVRYQPLSAEETGSPFGIGFALSTEQDEKIALSSAFTLTLDYHDLTIPYRAAAESRLALFMQQSVDDQGTLAWRSLPGRVDLAGKTVTAAAPGLGRFMLATTAAGDDGDFTLQPGGGMADYQVSLAMGSATASYPFPVPPAKAGPAPDLALNYNSLRVDGVSNLRNNQPGWAGIGWSLETGYVLERMDQTEWGDLTGGNSQLFLVLNGVDGRLIPVGGQPNQFVLQDDPRWRIERLVSSNTSHPDAQREYWLVTTPDGTRYRFGGEFDAETGADLNSAFYAPVYDFALCSAVVYRICNQVWRWNLDRVEDANGNVVVYSYTQETNWYSSSMVPTSVHPYKLLQYVRGGYPAAIEYTRRAGDGSAAPTARVTFSTAPRCLDPNTAGLCDWPADYPDTPADLACSGSGPCASQQPTFWITQRLSQVTTSVWETATSTWRGVDRWDLAYAFPAPPPYNPTYGFPIPDDPLLDEAYGRYRKLELQSLTRRSPDGTQSVPPVTFGYTFLQNRRNFDFNRQIYPMYLSRLVSVTNELGGVVSFTYASDCPAAIGNGTRSPYDCFKTDAYVPSQTPDFGIWMRYKVTERTVSSSLGGPAQTSTYSYGPHVSHYYDDNRLISYGETCPTQDPYCAKDFWFEMRGYNIVTVTGPGGAVMEYRYHRGMDGDGWSGGGGGGWVCISVQRSDGVTLQDHNWLRGRPYEVRTWNTGDVLAGREITEYSTVLTAGNDPVPGLSPCGRYTDAAHFTAVGEARSYAFDASGANPKETRSVFSYDGYGNITRETHYGDTANPADDYLIDRAFFANTSAWIVDRPQWRRVFAGNVRTADGTEKAMTAYGYDGLALFTGVPVNGNLTTTAAHHTISANYSDPANFYTATTQYDSLGRPTVSTDANGRSTTTSYHSVYGYAETATNALGHVANSVVDPGTGNLLQGTDPNGRVTSHEYDAFGRLLRTWLPGETKGSHAATVEASYTLGSAGTPSRITVKQRRDAGGAATPAYLESWRFFDELGRPIQSQSATLAGQAALSNTRYDAAGQAWQSSLAYEVAGAPGTYYTPDWNQPKSETLYDGLGRATQVIQPAGTTLTSYDGWTTTVIDANLHQRAYDVDAFGRTVQVREYSGTGPYTLYATTSYSYDVLGRLAQVTDAANNVTSMAYDPLGRKTGMVDPDMGSWSYVYDAVGNLTAQRDGRNQWLYFEYDVLNRLVAKRQDSANGALLAEYLFDAASQKGLLSRSKAYSAEGVVEIYNVTYDVRGRLTQQNWTVPGSGGGTFRLDFAYNAADQPATLRYPGGTAGEQGELVTTGFDALGRVNSVSGSGVSYVSSTAYNARGQVVEQRLDTGSNGLTRQYVYDQNTMRLLTLRAGVASPYTNLQNLSYTYDAVGNIASLVDGVNSSQRQCFQYDALDRLTHAFTGNSGCTAYATGGTGPYNHTYAFDAIGNIASYAGNAYNYAAGKPHAVSAAYGNSYGYDGNGNQTTRTIAGVTYTFVFDYENRLAEVKQGATSLATFLYDADGNRVKGTVSGVTTVYIAGIYERQGAAATSYYEGGGIRRSGYTSNNGVFYMLSDHLKSTSALVARNGVLNVKYFYYPYGARRGVPFNSITAKRFTGQYHETALPGGEGLSFYNARWYDPKLGSFLSADSIVPQPLDSQSFNRYAYAGGNPLRFSDPSGHTKLCGAACEDGYKWSARSRTAKRPSVTTIVTGTKRSPGSARWSDFIEKPRVLFHRLPVTSPNWTQGYGPNLYSRSNATRLYSGTSGLHGGLDFGGQAGTLVYAGVYGVIVNSSSVSMASDASPNVVVRSDQYYVLYGHVQRTIPIGSAVKPDDQIGVLVHQQTPDGTDNTHLHLAVLALDLEAMRKRNYNPVMFFADESPVHALNWDDYGSTGFTVYSVHSFLYGGSNFWDNPRMPAPGIQLWYWRR
jgi:RHS repeat-associated protein